jgi:hypothetical protein
VRQLPSAGAATEGTTHATEVERVMQLSLAADLDEALGRAAAGVHSLLAFRGGQPQQQFVESVRSNLLRDYVDELAAWAVGESDVGEQMRCWAEARL